MYEILEKLQAGDVVFHHVLEKASKKPSAFTSYSRVKDGFHIVREQDPLCHYPPPYRRVELYSNKRLVNPITIEMLAPYREELESVQREAEFTRSPFDKNFKIKQMYLSRIPIGFLEIFEKLSETTFDFH